MRKSEESSSYAPLFYGRSLTSLHSKVAETQCLSRLQEASNFISDFTERQERRQLTLASAVLKIHIRLVPSLQPALWLPAPPPSPQPQAPGPLLSPDTTRFSPYNSTLVTHLHSSFSIRQTRAVNRHALTLESRTPASVHDNLSIVCYCPGPLGFLINRNCSEARGGIQARLYGDLC